MALCGFLLLFGTLATWPGIVRATDRAVFAHYMLGSVTEAHAHQDIDDAMAMGLDGFALNIGDATQDWVGVSLNYMFGYAEYVGFKLYVSMDVYASGNACYQGGDSCNGPYDYQWIWDAWKGSTAYYQVNDLPLISTYSSGGLTNTTWQDWKDGLADDMFFMPDFDETEGYYDAAAGWYEYWGNVCDGIFSWETSWTNRSGYGSNFPGDVSVDLVPMDVAHADGKLYMMGLSPLQYKNAYGANVYRSGGLNLPKRMYNILNLAELPDFIQYQTWNDGPESHYMGNLWPEQNNDSVPWLYANQDWWPHTAWQPLVTSFITAFKNGDVPSAMRPQGVNTVAVGAAWYKTILTASADCPGVGPTADANLSMTYDQPGGFLEDDDDIYWAIVLDDTDVEYFACTWDNGVPLEIQKLEPGLNYGSYPLATGCQGFAITDVDANIIMSASGGSDVSDGCPSIIWNSNYQVIGLVDGSTDFACTYWPGDDPDVDEYGYDYGEFQGCDYSLTYDNLDDLADDSTDMNITCASYYLVNTLADTLEDVLTNYTDVNDGYDDMFDYYVTYVKDLIPTALDDYMSQDDGPGNSYFTCTLEFNGVNRSSKTCPYTIQDLADYTSYKLYFTLEDSEGFYSELSTDYGIESDWVKLSTLDLSVHCSGSAATCTRESIKWYGFPQKADSITVPNPKDIVAAAGTNFDSLQSLIDATYIDLMMSSWNGTGEDAVDTLAMPLALMQQAVQSMATVKSIGKTEKAEEKKTLIIEILTGIFAAVPFVGEEVAAAADLASLARIIAITGEAANTALDIYSVVEDPSSAPMVIFGELLGASAVSRSGENYEKLATLRRDMSDDDVAKLGSIAADQSSKIGKIFKRTCS